MICKVFEIVNPADVEPGNWQQLADIDGTHSFPDHYTIVNVAVSLGLILIDWYPTPDNVNLIVVASPHLITMGWTLEDLERYAGLVIDSAINDSKYD